jgi:predicted GNAT family acetyltransferase
VAETSDVQDRPEESRFVLEVDGHEAELVYRRDGGQLVLIHTGVPDELGGRGLGGVLVARAVEVARAEALVLRPECPYARAWLKRHLDEAAGVMIEWPED